MPRHLNVTANTTLDHVPARATADGWDADTVAILDVESPGDERTVRLGLELDADVDGLPHHASFVALSPDQARMLAADLKRVATAAENGEPTTSGRR